VVLNHWRSLFQKADGLAFGRRRYLTEREVEKLMNTARKHNRAVMARWNARQRTKAF
jgi:hypothetical protein